MSLLRTIFGIKSKQNNAIKKLDAQTFKEAIASKKIQLIDVRTPNEFQSGHIVRAKNIDYFSGVFQTEFNKLDKDMPVYIYCRSGARSRQAANKLSAMGFNEIYDLKGGISNYN
ncbi:rhodanese-like domain-containing protein [Cellulophaga sp. F20128]|nr:rhodanese-like domain-containing protein [Cellulophaga sp. F20128]